MVHNQTTNFQNLAAQYFLGSIALALVTLVFFRIHVDLASTAFAYLIMIVLFSLIGSFIASAEGRDPWCRRQGDRKGYLGCARRREPTSMTEGPPSAGGLSHVNSAAISASGRNCRRPAAESRRKR
jgi:hypothetical protein